MTRDELAYLASAPKQLVEIHRGGKTFPGREALGRLLTDQKMNRAWLEVKKRIDNEAQWKPLWNEITRFMYSAKKVPVTRREKQQKFHRIAKQANGLSKAILEGPLDLDLYELFHPDVLRILGIPNWFDLDEYQRFQFGYHLSRIWPTVPELLMELRARAEKLAAEELTKEHLVERVTRSREPRFFVLLLHRFFQNRFDSDLFGTLAKFATVIYQEEITKQTAVNWVKHKSTYKADTDPTL